MLLSVKELRDKLTTILEETKLPDGTQAQVHLRVLNGDATFIPETVTVFGEVGSTIWVIINTERKPN